MSLIGHVATVGPGVLARTIPARHLAGFCLKNNNNTKYEKKYIKLK
jgi:hypothetical protein